MPRKAQYNRQQIIDAAYELARKQGMEAVVSRSVAARLGCTTMPIFSFFTSMEELRGEVYERAKKTCVDYLMEALDYTPAFKEFGLRWVQFACREPALFTILFSDDPASVTDDFSSLFESITQSIIDGFGLDVPEAQELLYQMLIHANGIASFLKHKPDRLSVRELGRILSETCVGIVLTMKLENGTFDESLARRMIASVDQIPQKINGESNE